MRTNVKFYLSRDTKITLKPTFGVITTKELRALRGFFGAPMRLKYKKNVFHQFVLISL